MRTTLFRAVGVAALVATLAFPAGELLALARQQQQEKKKQEPQQEYAITVEVPLVNVDVVVTDNHGNFIPGLRKENFRILEDGVPQAITNFSPSDAPITIVILMEFSKLGYQIYAANAANWAYGFLSQLKKDDWAALVSYDLKPRIEVDFTRDKREIQNTLARMYFPGFSEANLFDALIDTLDRLKDVKGKKSILLLASGYDTFSRHTLDDALRRLRQSDVTIFSIGVGKELYEYYEARGRVGGPASIGYLQAENQLRSFARMTGGAALIPRFVGELPNFFQQVAAMLRNQYSLGYIPANKTRDGKFRKIKVELVNDDGGPLVVVDQKGKKVKYVIYAREGYLPPKGGVTD